MMGLGPMGGGAGGNSSSSTSNLSALAPPFTVDRLNPNPNSNPNVHYSNSPYPVEPYNPTWQYAPPSAPGPELVISSTGITSAPLSHDYQFSASASISPPSSTHWSALSPCAKALGGAFGYGGEVKPYHSPYVPPVVVGGDSLFVEGEGSRYNAGPTPGLSVTPQIDLFDLEYGPRWMDPLEFDDDGKRAKIIEWDGSLLGEKANVGGLHGYKNQMNQGEQGTENRNKYKEDLTVSYKKFNQVSDREVHTGSLNLAHTEDKSRLEQNLGFFPYDSNKTHVPAISSTYPESHPSVQSSEMHKSFSNYQESFTPYEKCVSPVDPPFTGPLSVIRSSPTVVIRPPPATNINLGRSVVSRKPVSRSDNVGGAHSVDFEHANSSKRKGSGLKTSSEITQHSFETNLFDFSEQGNGLFSSASVKEHSSKTKGKFVSQLPDTNVSGCFTMACDNNVQVVNSAEDSSDFVDHEDSPCWKGAPSSQFSKFDVETCNSNLAKKNLDEDYGFDHQKHQNLHSIVESGGAFPEKAGEENKNKKNECAGNSAVLTLGRNLDAICSSKEQSSMDVGITINDVSEGGAVAVHAAEKVLDSPASPEHATERSKIPDPNLNASTMIKAMHNLSELLLFHLSNDLYSLEEENSETLKTIISNLDSCLSKKTLPASNKQESYSHVGGTSKKLGESLNVGTISGNPCMTNESANSPVKLDSQSGKKDEKLSNFSPLTDYLDITRDDDMAEAIKKVLEDNFHLNEEMHSQALLFKNLWLDAEAKLCSISYKARFDRMKIQMEEIKHRAPPQENEDIAEMTSKLGISPDPITSSEQVSQAHDGLTLKPVSANVSTCSTSGHADDIMARFHILKSREDNTKPTEEEQPEMIDGDHAGSIMARFNILKSRDENSKLNCVEEEQPPKMIDGDDHARPIMARFNILKSRDESSKSSGMEEEKPPGMVDKTLNEARRPRFLHQTGGLGEDKFESYVDDGAGYEPLNEFHLSVTSDPIVIHPLQNSMMMTNQTNWGWRDSSSSSDWEHVLKDEISWKNM